jgi:hypothetical protein
MLGTKKRAQQGYKGTVVSKSIIIPTHIQPTADAKKAVYILDRL